MTGLIDTQQYSQVGYSKSAGRFRDLETGRFVPRDRVLLEIDREVERSRVRLQGITRLLIGDRVSLPEFQVRFAEELKLSHLRMAAFGAGGRNQLSSRQFGYIGQKLKSEYEYLDGFAVDLAAGKLTANQALNRAAMYADSTRSSFHRAEQQTKERDGFYGWRRLDMAAQHCPECPAYATDGYVPASQIVPIGENCTCARRCRCFCTYKMLSDRLTA